MLSGVMEIEADKPAILLRNYLMRMGLEKMKATPEVVYKKAERALQAFVEKTGLSTLYEAGGELFPLPEETVVGARARR